MKKKGILVVFIVLISIVTITAVSVKPQTLPIIITNKTAN